MDRIEKFKNVIEKYLYESQVIYFVDSYKRIYNYLHEDGDGRSYEVDYGRLYGLHEVLRYNMSEKDRHELLDLIISL